MGKVYECEEVKNNKGNDGNSTDSGKNNSSTIRHVHEEE